MRRVVLDTNVVLSALLFGDGRTSWVRHAWQRGLCTPLVCKETVNELLRVLAYPKFKLTAEEREALLADFLPYTESVTLPAQWPDLPQCRDEKDQAFLVLACIGKAEALISGDQDLLALRDEFEPCPILTAREWAQRQEN
jgi:putative PIN family toxin of toxin-antitoxin system